MAVQPDRLHERGPMPSVDIDSFKGNQKKNCSMLFDDYTLMKKYTYSTSTLILPMNEYIDILGNKI